MDTDPQADPQLGFFQTITDLARRLGSLESSDTRQTEDIAGLKGKVEVLHNQTQDVPMMREDINTLKGTTSAMKATLDTLVASLSDLPSLLDYLKEFREGQETRNEVTTLIQKRIGLGLMSLGIPLMVSVVQRAGGQFGWITWAVVVASALYGFWLLYDTLIKLRS